MLKSPVERLAETNPDLEVWWDSSPLVYDSWVEEMLEKADPDRKDVLEEQLGRLYNADDPAKSVFRGCTTNPSLSLKAVQDDPEFWSNWVDDLLKSNPGMTQKEAFWRTYKEVVDRGAKMFLPLFEASDYRYGWLSGQLDPRLFTEVDEMIEDAQELADLQPNVMVKVPASMQGMDVLTELTSRGISTNVTVCFALPQILAAADAVEKGRQIAEENGVDLSKWRSVITMMIGRLTEREALMEQARRRGIEPTWQERHWFGLAVFKRAYRMLSERGAASKMLACSLREGPLVAGKPRFWDIQEIAGGDIVYTLPPYVLNPFFDIGDDLIIEPRIDEPVPDWVMEKMLQIPYCVQAYDPNGMSLEQFNVCPPTRYTIKGFSKAAEGLEDFIAERMEAVGM